MWVDRVVYANRGPTRRLTPGCGTPSVAPASVPISSRTGAASQPRLVGGIVREASKNSARAPSHDRRLVLGTGQIATASGLLPTVMGVTAPVAVVITDTMVSAKLAT